ncbi:hypothetical protein CY34DRAFT_814340 [Suillus luteus UH-Slu-Lm8-n1]|uniref:Uncharacterized protein n=1 Tax=Suillus luteus UH-Slu-Lm8-n1 TaxID=930992 RepID=A0A0D0ADR6_9AGAM|nr:hypothetical protein CY34DRAFT_814340 [Suillus luteus UH-Slu-Lm8-n1]
MRLVSLIVLLLIWALGHDLPLRIPVLSGNPAGHAVTIGPIADLVIVNKIYPQTDSPDRRFLQAAFILGPLSRLKRIILSLDQCY